MMDGTSAGKIAICDSVTQEALIPAVLLLYKGACQPGLHFHTHLLLLLQFSRVHLDTQQA